MKDVKFSPDMVWLTYTQPLAAKLFQHLGSLFYLTRGTNLPKLADTNIGYIDYPSVTVLARAAFETFLTFHYIFVAPSTMEEKRFRYKIWEIGGLRDRQRFTLFTEEGIEKQQSEKKQLEHLLKEIKTTSFYNQLDNRLQKETRRGNWKYKKSWADLAEIAGFDRIYFNNVYCYLCSYAHTSNLSVLQIGQATNRNIQSKFAETWLGLGLILMGRFIFSYVSIYPKASSVLTAFPDAARTAKIRYDIVEDMKKANNNV